MGDKYYPKSIRKAQVMEIIVDFINTNHYSPSYRQIAERLPDYSLKSYGNLPKIVNELIDEGYLGRAPKHQNLWVIKPYEDEDIQQHA